MSVVTLSSGDAPSIYIRELSRSMEADLPAVEDQTSFSLDDPGFCNMVTHVARLLLSGVLLGLFIPHSDAAPVTYDQRQSGENNLNVKLEDILILFFTDTSKLSNLWSPELASTVAAHLIGRNSASKETPEKPLEATVYETEDAKGGKEPYHVDIVRIEKEEEASPAKDEAPEKLGAPGGISGEKIEQGKPLRRLIEGFQEGLEGEPDPVVSIDGSKPEKKTRSLWRNAAIGGITIIARKSKQLVDAVPVKNFDQREDLEVKQEASEATKPGMSLKKQLSKNQVEEKDASTSEERNELGAKSRELVLLGGGLENCGPGRNRDRKGICQEDQNFH